MKRVLSCLLIFTTIFADWARDQIESDLAAFPKKSITRQALKEAMREPRTINWHSEVALVEILGGVARVLERVHTGFHCIDGRLEIALGAINKWQSEVPVDQRLPDTLLLLSFGDGLDVGCCSGLIFPSELKVPVFVFSKRVSSNKLVLIPDHGAMTDRSHIIQNVERGSADFPWSRKKQVLFWRGSATDGEYTLAKWKSFPRAKLTLLSNLKPSLIDAGLTGLTNAIDAGAVDDILKCTGGLKKVLSIHGHLQYKYLMDIDGCSNGWDRCFWGLLSNSALFKQVTDFNQWYYRALRPWVHYIPVKADLSDLEERLDWAKSHDDQVRKIAEEGQKIAQEIFPREAVFGYMRQLIEAYNERLVD